MSGEWKPIETAPRGRRLLVGCFKTAAGHEEYHGIIKVDRWNERYKSGFGSFNEYYWPATHWMELPLPPKPNQKQKEAESEDRR